MRNPERTTKAERRAAKRWNPLAARTFGVAEAARYMRAGVLLDEAAGLDRLAYAMLVDRYSDVMSRLVEPHPRPTHTGYEVGTGPNPHITLKYPPHVSFVASVPYRNGKHHVDGLAEAWRQFRERHDPAEYADWDGDRWRDPNEVAAVHAEAIENALADDFDDEAGHHG